jgi:hypothetical protein
MILQSLQEIRPRNALDRVSPTLHRQSEAFRQRSHSLDHQHGHGFPLVVASGEEALPECASSRNFSNAARKIGQGRKSPCLPKG